MSEDSTIAQDVHDESHDVEDTGTKEQSTYPTDLPTVGPVNSPTPMPTVNPRHRPAPMPSVVTPAAGESTADRAPHATPEPGRSADDVAGESESPLEPEHTNQPPASDRSPTREPATGEPTPAGGSHRAATDQPDSDPPAGDSPATDPPATDPATTNAPTTDAATTDPAATDQSVTGPSAGDQSAEVEPGRADRAPRNAQDVPARGPATGTGNQNRPRHQGRGRGPAGPGRPHPGGRSSRPGRRPGDRAAGPSPVPPARRSGVVEPIVEPIDPHKWGRIDENGVVYVTTATGEREIGNWQAGDVEAGLVHFGRRYDDFSTKIALLEARLASGTGDPKATKQQAIALRDSVDELPAIGDLDGAAARLEIVIGAADAAIAGASVARTAARAAAIQAKEALCVEAEQLADSTQWKVAGDRLKTIVDEWRSIRGVDRKTDDALWKRFAKARDAFTRRRGSHFAELDKQRIAAKEAKEELIARAEALADATDWGSTAAAYRDLMSEWKSVGRAPRDVEDALWARFRAAQDRFFSRRKKTFADRDAEFVANAKVKEQLLSDAEALDPSADLDAAKASLRSIHERWEAAGKVPRERIRELDSRLRAVEDRVRRAEERHWRRTDPETAARVEQFRLRADGYRAQAARARSAGDERKAKQADQQAQQWEEWLRAAEGAVDR